MRNPFRKKKREIPHTLELQKFDEDILREYYFLSVKELQSQKRMHDKAMKLCRKRKEPLGVI